ncbi:MAG: hypothetical protein KatS3mg105_0984 [Gemmatales bacterium]|nr:MAG: hypothetical protein KatS3mg105_0984 [Gemmatales bacterium]
MSTQSEQTRHDSSPQDGSALQTRAAHDTVLDASASQPQIDVTIFVACYNEEANIVDTIETIVAAMREVKLRYEILVIDDASRDRSVEMVEAYQRTHPEVPLILHKNAKNRGLAYNFVEGAFLGRGTYYKLVCGDNVESKEGLVRILQQAGKADIVIPYHLHCQGKSRMRMFISRTFTRIVNLLSGYHLRYYNGMALYRRYHVQRWHSDTTGFGFQADLLTRLLNQGFSFIEIETDARERTKGSSGALSIRNLLCITHTLLEITIRRIRKFIYGT